MDAITDPRNREVWVMKSAQVGWTEILNNVIGYHIDQDPAPILLVQPTLEMAEAWSKDRLAPMLRDTPCLRNAVADPKSRDSGNTLLHKKFTGGHLTVAGSNSPASLASRPIRIVGFDEVDRFPASAGSEGDPISLGKKRSTTFWNRKVLAGSTPTVKGSSRIEAGFDASDQRFYFVACPHCAETQRLVWAQVRWPDGRPREALYHCKACGAGINDAEKAEMLRNGEWRSTKPSNGIAGFHISELYSPWSTFGEMAESFLEAKKLPETLRAWINTSLGETWEERGDTVDAAGLIARRETYTADLLPPGVLVVTVGTDVQDDRLEYTIYGWGADEEAWRLEHGVLRGNPGSAALWQEHDDILRRRFATEDGRTLVVRGCCVDSGGHFTQQVYQYCAARKRFNVWAIKGAAAIGRLIWPKKASRAEKSRLNLWIIGVDTAKDLIYGRLNVCTKPGPGYFHFDAGTTAEWLEQLTSETAIYKVIQGRRVKYYKPKTQGSRQEALDTTVYAYAALVGSGGERLLRALATRLPRKAPPDVPPDDSSTPPAAEQIPTEDAGPVSSAPSEPATAAPVRRKQATWQKPGGWINRFRR
jgi:phage terminase large subunit GpA-like protein